MMLMPRIDENNEWRYGIPIPSRDNTSFDGGFIWYILTVWQHFILSLLFFITIFGADHITTKELLPMSIEGFKMLTILAQVLNFIMGMNLFGNAPPVSIMSNDDRLIKMWLLVEISLTICLLLSNIVGMLLRFCHWPDFGTISIEHDKEKTKDYLASDDPQLLISSFSNPFFLLVTNMLLTAYFANFKVPEGTFWLVLVQTIMQALQILCFIFFFFTPFLPNSEEIWYGEKL